MKRVTIEVTGQDIERAHRNDSYKCVVAQAIARTVPDARRIEVDSQTIRFTSGDERLVYLTPYTVQGYVIAFDAGDPVEPFKFQLRNPITARRNLATAAGKTAKKEAQRVRRAERRANPSVDDQAVRQAAKAAYDEARALDPGPISVDDSGRHAPPRVFKKKQRSYGHRLLRINQESAGTPEPAVIDAPPEG